jgi:hypothetical protein
MVVRVSGSKMYAGAAQNQLDFLLEKAPRTSDGAISHLMGEAQLWVSLLLSTPLPFTMLIISPLSHSLDVDRTLLRILRRHIQKRRRRYNQIKLYRAYLLDTSKNNYGDMCCLGRGLMMRDIGLRVSTPFLFFSLFFFVSVFRRLIACVFLLGGMEGVCSGWDVKGLGNHMEFAV